MSASAPAVSPPTTGSVPAASPPAIEPTGSPVPPLPPYPCICPGHTSDIVELTFSAPTVDGLFFLTASNDKTAMLRDAATGDWLGSFVGHTGSVRSAHLNKSATRVVTGSSDNFIMVWNALTGELLHKQELPEFVRSVAFSPNDEYVAVGLGVGSFGCDALVFGVRDFSKPMATLPHPKPVYKVVWLNSSSLLLTACGDGALRVWDLSANKVVASVQVAACAIEDVELSLDGKRVAAAAGKTIAFFDAATLTLQRTHTMADTVSSVSVHPLHGKTFVAAVGFTLATYNAETGAEIASHKGHHGRLCCVRFSPLGDMFASGANDACVRLWPAQKLPEEGAPATSA